MTPSVSDNSLRLGPIALGVATAYGVRFLVGIPYIILIGLLELEPDSSPEAAVALVDSQLFLLGMVAIATAGAVMAGYVVPYRVRSQQLRHGVYTGAVVLALDLLLLFYFSQPFAGLRVLDAIGLLLIVPASACGAWWARSRAWGAD